jgi:siroheme synthase
MIGVGCGDTDLISLEAISYTARADAFVCAADVKQRFAKHMGNKPILLDMYDFGPRYKAGYYGGERIVAANLDGLLKTADKEPEKLLWMIYVGPCLSPDAKLVY